MRSSELAQRYAKALFELSQESNATDRILSEIRVFKDIFEKDRSVSDFLNSPLMAAEAKEELVGKAIATSGASDLTQQFICLIAKKGRLKIFGEIVSAFEREIDEKNGVIRGVVKSASVLLPEDRGRIEEIVSKFTHKQAILTYKEDPSVIGGLIASVGSHTFDDTLTSHLRRLKDQINRSSH